MPRFSRNDIATLAQRMGAKSADPTRHKCFISYHQEDIDEIAEFLESFGTEFIARTVGVTDEDPFINSTNDDYIKEQIGSKYMTDSTVTILLVGRCTWARRFVDWEIAATLRDNPNNKRAGLLAYKLPSANEKQTIPSRLSANYNHGRDSYAQYNAYPSGKVAVRNHIEIAFQARTAKLDLLDNSAALRKKNSTC